LLNGMRILTFMIFNKLRINITKNIKRFCLKLNVKDINKKKKKEK